MSPNRHESRFRLPRMDCASEENLVRMALGGQADIETLAFDLPGRTPTVVHTGEAAAVLAALQPLGLGATLESSRVAEGPPLSAGAGGSAHAAQEAHQAREAHTLRILLGINAAMFLIELLLGWVAQSTGLIADSLDMFADAAVYGLALFAVGRAASHQLKAAHLAGWLQALLALGALAEVVRRALYGSEPVSALMMGVGLLALAANVVCLRLVARSKDGGAHMRASYIFSATDVIANLGVILAGVLVAWSGSPLPDLIIGTAVAAVVLAGARRILRLR